MGKNFKTSDKSFSSGNKIPNIPGGGKSGWGKKFSNSLPVLLFLGICIGIGLLLLSIIIKIIKFIMFIIDEIF